METMTLRDWLDCHYITYSIRKDILVIPEFGRFLIQENYDHIFKQNKDGSAVLNITENPAYLIADEIFYVTFPFGKRWYYVDIRKPAEEQQFNILRYVGPSPKYKHECLFYPLGIHSGYELLNGSGLMKDWCAKAKFLGYEGLSVADRNTLAVSLDLQQSANNVGLRFCFGYSLTIKIGDTRVGAKVYSATQEGFRNLLRIQKIVAVDNEDNKEIEYIDLLNHAAGNTLVFDKLSGGWLAEKWELLVDIKRAFDGWVYFQVDVTEYRADRIDSAVLVSTKAYFDAYYMGDLKYYMNIRPVLIQDTYYLDKEDWKTKIILNKIASGAAHEQSHDQYMKTIDELYDEFRSVFSDKYDDDVFYDMCEATADIIENATASYDLTENYAPKYDMTPEEQKKYGTTLNMFNQLIEEGFKKLVPDGEEEKYRERVEYEKYIIMSTDNVDYCLITWDELNWAQKNGILTGIGRGSAGGSLLLYLLGITKIDPLKYDLIFERFLLPERGGLAPMDVTKIESNIESNEYVEILLRNGQTIRFDKDAEFLVERDGVRSVVYADELEEDDDIIWDRKDELFTLDSLYD